MAFRQKPKQPEFQDLKGILAQSKDTDNATYQTLQILIERLTQFQFLTLADVDNKQSADDAAKKFATKFASYITKNDDTAQLPNSIQLLAGSGITLDYSIPNKLTISSTGGGGSYYDAPLTDGNPDETDLIFANGECVIVQVPNAP